MERAQNSYNRENPWNRGRGFRGASARGNRNAGRGISQNSVASRLNENERSKADSNSSKDKFHEAKERLQASVKKHMMNDESSEEEDLESSPILDSVLKTYCDYGGDSDNLGRTQHFLEDAFQSGAATCLICISSVKRQEAIWNCIECYCFFHLTCIQKWAKDSVIHQKRDTQNLQFDNSVTLFQWPCPKCRHEYSQQDTPNNYLCFCRKVTNPKFEAWQVPHSCGENCGKALQPLCGHDCLLLCHPGPCPPCPKMVQVGCHCGKKPPRSQRCSVKEWSCGNVCGRQLLCQKHRCSLPCHCGPCEVCPKTSLQLCMCKTEKKLRPCSDPHWQCDKVCGKDYTCGHHKCSLVCHSGGCGDCPLALSRKCPCGKQEFTISCIQDTPTCGNTCGRYLECGVHTCSRICHRDKCGTCLEVAMKSCRCGLYKKELPCIKEYLCEKKCKNIRDCQRHPCNRKCCDGNCPPCEKPCGNTLLCGYHKCTSVCHRGPCYPCSVAVDVRCRCGKTFLKVPCGRQRKTKPLPPPRCSEACKIDPICHHPTQKFHCCHFGDCPPCTQICNKIHPSCQHLCLAKCHSAVWVVTEVNKRPIGPWEKGAEMELRELPCPDCKVPVSVTCFGGHETYDLPCYMAKPGSCEKICGRKLSCGNHVCNLICHVVNNAPNELEAGDNCEVCESGCTKPHPKGCSHACPKPCHQGDCPKCTKMIRKKCHCGLNQMYAICDEWTSADEEKRNILLCCGDQCPKNYGCGHRCVDVCHPGNCANANLCKKKVKVFCKCHRLRKEFLCCEVSTSNCQVECDDECRAKLDEIKEEKERERLRKAEEEFRKNREELEKFEKKFQSRKKGRHKQQPVAEERTFLSRIYEKKVILMGILFSVFAIITILLVVYNTALN